MKILNQWTFIVVFWCFRISVLMNAIHLVGCDAYKAGDEYKRTYENIHLSLAAIQLYRLETGEYPNDENWQDALVERNGGFASSEDFKDQWGDSLRYRLEKADRKCIVIVYSKHLNESGEVFLQRSENCKKS